MILARAGGAIACRHHHAREAAMRYCHHETPVGALLLAAEDGALRLISFPRGSKARQPEAMWISDPDAAPFPETIRQLDAYFARELREFNLPLQLEGTPFQVAAWRELRAIPYGETTTYGVQAERMGRPKASRAVGAANGNNPISIVVPCHRVVGSTGKLTGFGGGLETKAFLLDLERRVVTRQFDFAFAS